MTEQEGHQGGTGVPPVQTEKISRRHLPHWQRKGAVYFLTWRCARGVILAPEERAQVMSAIRFWDNTRWHVFAAVVMPDHVHVLAQPLAKDGGVWDLTELLHSVKSYSAHRIVQRRKHQRDRHHAGSPGKPVIWQDERYDRWVRDEEEFAEKWQYIAENPVKNGLVPQASDYSYLYLLEEFPK